MECESTSKQKEAEKRPQSSPEDSHAAKRTKTDAAATPGVNLLL
jgi:hypothetical protein